MVLGAAYGRGEVTSGLLVLGQEGQPGVYVFHLILQTITNISSIIWHCLSKTLDVSLPSLTPQVVTILLHFEFDVDVFVSGCNDFVTFLISSLILLCQVVTMSLQYPD